MNEGGYLLKKLVNVVCPVLVIKRHVVLFHGVRDYVNRFMNYCGQSSLFGKYHQHLRAIGAQPSISIGYFSHLDVVGLASLFSGSTYVVRHHNRKFLREWLDDYFLDALFALLASLLSR